jgi:hypothetical protein
VTTTPHLRKKLLSSFPFCLYIKLYTRNHEDSTWGWSSCHERNRLKGETEQLHRELHDKKTRDVLHLELPSSFNALSSSETSYTFFWFIRQISW